MSFCRYQKNHILFLQELGIQDENHGVFDGTWKGSGEVTENFQ